VLVYERFSGFGINAAVPAATVLILVSLVVFILLHTLVGVRRRRATRLGV
jgi:ABC-type sulfate transport system permease component